MENNKKQQQFHARTTKSCVSADVNRKSSDLHANKSRNSRRHEQIPTPRNDQQQRKTKQQQQPAKLRPNVDKRPRARGGYAQGDEASASSAYNDPTRTGDDHSYSGAGLAAAGGNYPRSDFELELNSVYVHGSKKQNLNHLLNFHCVPRDVDYATEHGIRGHYNGHQSGAISRKPRYNKEQFLQANFQFVIRACAKAQVNGSPDTLIDWNLIEQINIQTTEEPQCPICLYPPVAAKLTRCGHAYCWPCLLHYLSLSDKSWRKCPICYDAIHASDLKSCTIEQQCALNVGDRISFQLMRRTKGSMYIERFSATMSEAQERFPLLSSVDDAKLYSKFLIAKRSDVATIIERERRELMAESDVNCPEDVFIQQALFTLSERREKLGMTMFDFKEDEELKLEEMSAQSVLVAAVEVPNEEHPILPLSIEAVEMNNEEKSDVASVPSGDMPSCSGAANAANNNKYYYFYQSNDGQNIYLHPLNVKMLQACYGSLDQAPLLIEADILQKEQHSMDEDRRRKFTCLGHLPLTCQFSVVEVELQPPIVSNSILRLFNDDLLNRKKERQRREREERKREQQINEINDRQMGKLIASAANLNLNSSHEFPTCGFEEGLPPLGASPKPMTIPSGSGARYASVAVAAASASPKVELWPTIGGNSPTTSSSYKRSSLPMNAGAWGRAAPPTPTACAAPSARSTAEADNELHASGPWALGELLVGALDQQKLQQRSAKANAAAKEPNPETVNKKQKKSKSKKMVPLFAMGMNRAP